MSPPHQDPTPGGLVRLHRCCVLRPAFEASAGAQTSVDLGEGSAHLFYLPLKLLRRFPRSYPALERSIHPAKRRLPNQSLADIFALPSISCVARQCSEVYVQGVPLQPVGRKRHQDLKFSNLIMPGTPAFPCSFDCFAYPCTKDVLALALHALPAMNLLSPYAPHRSKPNVFKSPTSSAKHS